MEYKSNILEIGDNIKLEDALTVDKISNYVGIGTDSPDYKLDVAGDMGINGYIYHNGDDSRIGFEGNDAIRMYTANSVRLQIDSSGNVGIGTTSPGDKLTVQDGTVTSTDSSGTNYAKLDRFSGLTLKGNGAGTRGVQTPNTDALTLGTNNTERIRITSTGDVGINNTSPTSKLDVDGIITTRSSQVLRRYVSSWTNATTHDVLYNGWTSSTGDYVYLKVSGNSTSGHGIAAIGDNGFWLGRTDIETGALTDSATNPIGTVWLRSDSSGNITATGTITATGGNSTEWNTAYDNSITSAAVTGTTTKTLTLNQQDGGTVTATWTDSAGVTSVSSGDGIVLTGTSAAPVVNIDYSGTDNAILTAVDASGSTIGTGAKIWYSDDGTIAHANVSDLPFASSSHNHDSDYVNVSGDTMTGNLTIANNNSTLLSITGANSSYTSAAIKNTGTGDAKIWFDASNGDLAGSDYASVGQHNDLNLVLSVGANGGDIVFQESGGETMRIHDGNVGIGETNPGYKLDVNGTLRTVGNTYLQADTYIGTSTSAYMQFNRAGYNYIAATASNGSIVFRTGGASNRMIIFPNGNVGINETNPSQKLDVNGNIRVTGAYYDSNNSAGTSGQVLSSTATGTDWVSLSEISGVDGSGTANYIAKWSDADTITNSVIYDNGTNVGVGTTDSTAKLNVEDSIGIKRSGVNAVATIQQTGTGLIINAPSGYHPLVIKHNGSELYRFTNAGNVGIGTTSPSTKLHIEDNTPFLTLRGTDSSYSNAGIQLISGNASNNRALGIFHYVENSDVEWFAGLPYSGNDAYVINRNTGFTSPSSQSSPPGIGASQGRLLTINSSGNVGIGETSPAYKLDVNGNIRGTAYRIGSATVLSGSTSVSLGSSGSTGTVSLVTTSGQGLVLNGSNVGIGTTTPGSELEVDGEITTTTITYPEPAAVDSSAYNGEIVYFGSFESGIIGAGTLMSLGNDGGGNMRWNKAVDNVEIRATGLLGITLGTSISAGLLVRGIAKNSSWSSFTAGDKLYLSPTSGNISNSITGDTNDFVRIVGYALGNSKIYFCPDNTYIKNA